MLRSKCSLCRLAKKAIRWFTETKGDSKESELENTLLEWENALLLGECSVTEEYTFFPYISRYNTGYVHDLTIQYHSRIS